MTTKMTFGECLKYLLTTLDISISRLSKAINVDSSLISRWIHEKRIPPYDTSYIDCISQYLSKNICSTMQMKQLDKFFTEFQDKDDLIEGNQTERNQEKIKKVLLMARRYSVECKKNEQRKNKTNFKNKKTTNKMAYKYPSGNEEGNSITNGIDFLNNTTSPNVTNFTTADVIIHGIENIISASKHQLEAAALHKSNDNDIIYIKLSMESSDAFYNQWITICNILIKAIKNGWNVILVIQISTNMDKLMKFIKITLPLIETGKVNIFYYNKYNIVSMEGELFIVSGISALSVFSPGPQSSINSAFYLQNKAAVDIFTNNISVLIKTHTRNLVQYYSPDMREEYFSALTESIKIKGNQLNYNCNFNMELLSQQLYEKLLLKKKMSLHDQQLFLKYYNKQLHAITANLQNHKIKNIYFAKTMENLVYHRTIYFDTYSGIETVELEVQDIKDYITNIIYFIDTYDNYEVAVIFQDYENLKKYSAYQYIIKERHAVFFHDFESFSNKSVQLSIEEPMVVRACTENFKELWDRIAPVHKDKGEIITWLQSFVDML